MTDLETVLARLTKELVAKEAQLEKLHAKGDDLQQQIDLLKADIEKIKHMA